METGGSSVARSRYDDETFAKLQDATTMHKDTTATLARSAQVVENTQQLGADTLVELQNQREKLDRLDRKLDEAEQDVTFSERVVRWFSRQCCCFACCECCCADDFVKKQQQKDKRERYNKRMNGRNVTVTQAAVKANGTANGTGAGASADDTAIRERYKPMTERTHVIGSQLDDEYGREIQDETKKQDVYLDQIANGLDNLKELATVMGEEVRAGNEKVDQLTTRTEGVNERVKDMRLARPLRPYAS